MIIEFEKKTIKNKIENIRKWHMTRTCPGLEEERFAGGGDVEGSMLLFDDNTIKMARKPGKK